MGKQTGQKIFLVDAAGAAISVLFLAFLYSFEELFGMPRSVLMLFIFIAISFSIYSTAMYLINPANWKIYLLIIAVLNISYCIFTVYHIILNLNTLTLPGRLYFAAEILLVLTLSVYELKLGSTTAPPVKVGSA